MRPFFLLVLCWITHSGLAQDYTRYANLYLDNDFFFVTDYYYSSGIFFQYGKEHPSAAQDSLRHYRLWELGQEMYTPSDRYSTDPTSYDYPYGGWSYVKHTRQRELSPQKQIEVGVQIGVTGDWSLARWMQNTYHRNVLGLPNNAWVDQVANAFHLNLFAGSFHQKQWGEHLQFRRHNYARIGTQRTDIGLRTGINIGTAEVLGLGANSLYNHRTGDGIYLGVDAQYVFHDYMTSGSLFNDKSPFTTDTVPFRMTVELGIAFRGEDWKFLFQYKNRSPDNGLQPSTSHHLMNLTYSRFF